MNGLGVVPRRWVVRRWAVLAFVVGVGAYASSCGSSPTAAGSGDTQPSGRAPDGAVAADIVPLCQDVPMLGPVRDGGRNGPGNPPMEMVDAMQSYGAEHPDTFAGFWFDRDHGGTAVVAFTDDPAPHRAALESRTLAPGDARSVQTAVAPGGSPVPTSAPSVTTVGESGWAFDVVQARHSSRDLEQLANRFGGDLGVPGVVRGGGGINQQRNRVYATIEPADESVRRLLAARWPADMVCVEAVPQPDDGWPDDVPVPTTLIPVPGTDPWVQCGAGGLPFPASNRANHPSLDPSDPLAVAFREAMAGEMQGMIPPGIQLADYFLLARSDRLALFAAGSPPRGLITLEQRDGRWRWAGSGGSCEQVRALSPPGVGVVTWTIDPAFPPQPGDTVVHLLATEQACRSGKPMGDRLLAPEVVVRDDQVLVALGVSDPPGVGMHTCQGNPSQPVAVTLPEPLGERTIVDGRMVPPQPRPIAGGLG